MNLIGHYNYLVSIFLMMVGFFVVICRGNLIKKLIGLNIFSTSVFILYITMGKVADGSAPIVMEGPGPHIYSNPLPHVLILTAIVVGVATTAVGLALTVRIKERYGTIEEDEIRQKDESL